MATLHAVELSPMTDTADISTARALRATKKGIAKITLEEELNVLRKVEAGKNELTSCHFVEKCTNLAHLDLNNNQIEKTKPLTLLSNINVLNMSHNLISKMSFIAKLQTLKALVLNDNKLTEIPALAMPSLNTLILSKNSITEIDVTSLPKLEKLALAHNQLTVFPDISNSIWMSSVNVSHNEIPKIPKGHITRKHVKLSTLEMGFNKIGKLRSLEPLNAIRLSRLTLYGNPVCDKEDYHTKLLIVCPNLTHLDNKPTTEMHVQLAAKKPELSAEKSQQATNEREEEREEEEKKEPMIDNESKSKDKSKKSKKKPKKKVTINEDQNLTSTIQEDDNIDEPQVRKRKKLTRDEERRMSGVVKIKEFKRAKKQASDNSVDIGRLLEQSAQTIVGSGESSW